MRDYDASSSTWTTADSYRGSLAQPSTLHRYGFVENSPVNSWDAYGWCMNSQGQQLPGPATGSHGYCSEADRNAHFTFMAAMYSSDATASPTSPFVTLLPSTPTGTSTQTSTPTQTATQSPTSTQSLGFATPAYTSMPTSTSVNPPTPTVTPAYASTPTVPFATSLPDSIMPTQDVTPLPIRETTAPAESEWTGWAGRYDESVMQIVIDNSDAILDASYRHGLVSNPIDALTPEEKARIYTVAAVLYQESWGYRVGTSSQDWLEEQVFPYISNPLWFNASIGYAQMQVSRAYELQNAGLIFQSGSRSRNQKSYEMPWHIGILGGLSGGNTMLTYRMTCTASDLTNPAMAAEYIAANFEYAMMQPNWGAQSNGQAWVNGLGNPMSDSEKFSAWYMSSQFDVVTPNRKGNPNPASGYANYTWQTSQFLQNNNLLGIE